MVMVSTDSDAVDYDSDFEEASDDNEASRGVSAAELRKSSGSVNPKPRRAPTRGSSSRQGQVAEETLDGSMSEHLPPCSKQGRRSRPRPEEEPRVVTPAPVSEETSFELMGSGQLGAGGSNPPTGRRLVRGRISVGDPQGDSDGRRPGTGDSTGRNGTGGGSTASRPLWLQHDDTRGLQRHVSPNRGATKTQSSGGDPLHRGGTGDLVALPRAPACPRQLSRGSDCSARGAGVPLDRPPSAAGLGRGLRRPSDPDPYGLGAAGPSGTRAGGSRSRPPGGDSDFDAENGRAATADVDQRKIKRLQQEISRLSQRLKEAELYSSQDEGIPVFTLDEVEVGCQIAQGGFSSVHFATWRSTPCALKKIFDPVITAELREEFENEVKMLRRLRHPNVIILMAVCRQPPALSILTELVAGGSLFEVLHGPPAQGKSTPKTVSCEPSQLLPVLQQSGGALAYLHAMLVVHRDVKSQNVLLTPGRRPIAKLCDFGLARVRSELCTGSMQWAGTACYMAPELFAKRKYTEAVDVFAFGVMLWETVSAEIPHANLEAVDIAHRVQHKDAAGLSLSHSWPKSLKALLRATLSVQAEDRPSMVSVVEKLQQVVLDFPAVDD